MTWDHILIACELWIFSGVLGWCIWIVWEALTAEDFIGLLSMAVTLALCIIAGPGVLVTLLMVGVLNFCIWLDERKHNAEPWSY